MNPEIRGPLDVKPSCLVRLDGSCRDLLLLTPAAKPSPTPPYRTAPYPDTEPTCYPSALNSMPLITPFRFKRRKTRGPNLLLQYPPPLPLWQGGSITGGVLSYSSDKSHFCLASKLLPSPSIIDSDPSVLVCIKSPRRNSTVRRPALMIRWVRLSCTGTVQHHRRNFFTCPRPPGS